MKTAYGLDIPQSLREVCDQQRIALLVYDMQVGILSQIKNPEQITGQVLKVLNAARDAGVRVFFSRHLSLPKELMGMFQFRMAMAWQRVDSPEEVSPWFLRDHPSFQIIPELAPRQSEGVFDKLTMSALEGTWLDFALRDCSINAFIIVGVATEIGIEPTARHGADLGYIPVLVTDACGAGNEEAVKRSIESLRFAGDALITNTETICDVFRNQSRPRLTPHGSASVRVYERCEFLRILADCLKIRPSRLRLVLGSILRTKRLFHWIIEFHAIGQHGHLPNFA